MRLNPQRPSPQGTLWSCAVALAALGAFGAFSPTRAHAAELIECTPGSYGLQILNNTDDSSYFVDAARVAAIFPGGIPLINNYDVMYVNSNGNMTFDASFTSFTPDGFPGLDQPTVGPYFGDVDLRPSSATRGLFLCEDPANKRFIITWNDVGYFSQSTDKLNSFQAILTDTADENPCTIPTMQVEFRYRQLQWTAGSASGGAGGIWLGVTGAAAAAGIDAGDGTNIIELPNSKTNEVVQLVNMSNVGEPGVFRYTVVQGTFPICGNGTPELCEQCDDSNTNNNDGCTNLCLSNICGDGFVLDGVEVCDVTEFSVPVSCPDGYSGTPLCNNDPANPAADGTCGVSPIPGGCTDINECVVDPTVCGAGTCNNTAGGYTCACDPGFIFNGTTCIDIAVCIADPSVCCDPGYTFDGAACADIDECAADPALCGAGTCTNTPGGYTCACDPGYTFDGTTCADIDECALNPALCGSGVCTNEDGGYTCACDPGFYFNGTTCIDVATCVDNPVVCCGTGYTFDGTTCVDVNECADSTDNCHADATCNNVPGGFVCVCNAGYAGDGVTCADVDECAADPTLCGVGTCTNSAGSYTCACPSGYTFNGTTCADDDECALNPALCGAGTCANTGGGYTCACDPGYTFNGTTCADDDECAANPALCGVGTCTNSAGSYTCACPSGYTFDGMTCADDNECADPTLCGVGTCTNEDGGYACACPSGYTFDGVTCADIDECALNPALCGAGTCVNTGGGYTCACDPGYTFDAMTCVDANGCDPNPCYPGVACTDEAPPSEGFACGACPDGFAGDGVTCEAIVGNVAITAPADGAVTNQRRPVISGTADPGEEVTVTVDGEVIGTATADASGAWTFTPTDPLAEGTHRVEASVTNDEGQTATVGVNVTVDTIAPWVIIDAPTDGADLNAPAAEISGQSEPNTTITVYVNGEAVGTVTTDASGAWSVTLPAPTADGAYTVRVVAQDEAGNQGQETASFDVITDAAVAISQPAQGATVRTASPTVSGTGTPGATITVYVDGAEVGTVTVAEDGTWSWTPDAPLAEGAATVRVVATVDGVEAGEATVSFSVDLTTTGVVINQPSPDSVIKDSTPTFSGTAAPGAEVVILGDDGVAIGTVTADANGEWSFTPSDAIADGSQTFTIQATDGDGAVTTATVTVTIDTVPPALEVLSPAPGDVLDGSPVTASGTAEPGATVNVYVDGELVATVTAGDDGTWSVTLSDDPENGPHNIWITATDEAGNTTLTTLDVTVDIAPVVEDIGDTSGADTSGADTATNDDTATGGDTATSEDTSGADTSGADTATEDVGADTEKAPAQLVGGAECGCSSVRTEQRGPASSGAAALLVGFALVVAARRRRR